MFLLGYMLRATMMMYFQIWDCFNILEAYEIAIYFLAWVFTERSYFWIGIPHDFWFAFTPRLLAYENSVENCIEIWRTIFLLCFDLLCSMVEQRVRMEVSPWKYLEVIHLQVLYIILPYAVYTAFASLCLIHCWTLSYILILLLSHSLLLQSTAVCRTYNHQEMADMMDTSLETLYITTMCIFSNYILVDMYLSCGGCIFE